MKKIIRIVIVLLAAGCAAAFAAVLWRNQQHLGRLTAAQQYFDAGDFAAARRAFSEYLRHDPGNQSAREALAAVLARQSLWFAAAGEWRRLTQLEDRPEYREQELKALTMAGAFSHLRERLEEYRRKDKLSSAERQLLALALLATGDVVPASVIVNTPPPLTAAAVPYGGLLDYYLHPPADDEAKKKALVPLLAAADSPAVKFLILRALCPVEMRLGQLEEALAHAQDTDGGNAEWAAVTQGDIHHLAGRNDEAAAAYRQALALRPDPAVAVKLGELLAAAQKSGELRTLAAKFTDGNREMLLAGVYLDALLAQCEQRPQDFVRHMRALNNAPLTPLAVMLALRAAVMETAVDDICTLLLQIRSNEVLRERYPAAAANARQAAAALQQAGRGTEAARIAAIINDPAQPDLALTRLIIRENAAARRLTAGDAAKALRDFPADPEICREIAADALIRGDYPQALAAARSSAAAASLPVRLQIFMALAGLGQTEAAAAELRQICKETPDSAYTELYGLFCLREGLRERLQELHGELTAQTPAPRLLPVLQAELLYYDGKPEAAADILETAAAGNTWDPQKNGDAEFIFRIALRLGGADHLETALRLYLSIADTGVNALGVQLNLAEIYAARKERAAALQAAAAALRIAPSIAGVRECYGLRQLENGDLAAGVETLTPLLRLPGVSSRALPAWRQAQETLIPQDFAAGKKRECAERCAAVRAFFPDNPVAAEWSEKLRPQAAPENP